MATCRKCGNSHNDVSARMCKLCGDLLPPPGARATARVSSNWRDTTGWKRHQLVRMGAGPLEIDKGKPFVFGRASDCDLPIHSAKVSRHHARIVWEGEDPALQDLDSQNGTLVNDKPVRHHKLADGDEITIGPFVCTYRCLSGRGSIKQAKELDDTAADTQALLAAVMMGELGEVSVYELLETLGYNQKTGTLEIYGPDEIEGRVTIQEGVATHAEAGKLLGDRAILHLLGWQQGRYRFVTGFDPDLRHNVRGTIQHLLRRYASTLPPDGPARRPG